MKKDVPFFSVVIPVYNKASTLVRAVESVFRQGFRDFEIIAVDDGSSDDGLNILNRMSKEHENLRVLHQRNSGVSAARNSGIKAAKGQWVAFLDADDFWMPDMLHEFYALIAEYPEVGMVGTNYYSQRGSKLIAYQVCSKHEISRFLTFGPLRIPFNSSCHAVRRDVLLEIGGYDENLSYYEDAHLMFRIADKRDVAVSYKPLAVYTTDGNGKLSQKGYLQSKGRLPHLDYLEKKFKKGDISGSALRCGLRWLVFELKRNRYSRAKRLERRDWYPCLYSELCWMYKLPLIAPLSFFLRKIIDGCAVRLRRPHIVLMEDTLDIT